MGKAIPKIKEFPDDDRIWRVDWFGSIERNPQVPTEPKIQVIISPIGNTAADYSSVNAVEHDARQSITVGVGQLPVISIGSLWMKGQRLAQCAGKAKLFNDVQITPETVRLVRSDFNIDGDALIKRQFHRVGAGLSANCLAIKWKNDPYGIIIPVVEIIRFYYARSTRLAKAVFFGDFRHNLGSIVNPSECGIDREKRHAFVKLRKNFYDPDAFVIARILFDVKAAAGVNVVHDSIFKQSIDYKRRFYPEAAFPFEGKTNLQARIKPINIGDNRWRYIVFELERCTGAFPYDRLTGNRDNNSLQANEATDLPNAEKIPAYIIKNPNLDTTPENELQSEEEPDASIQSAVVLLPDDCFGAIEGMVLESPEKEMCLYVSAGNIQPIDLSCGVLGTGDGNYAVDNVVPVNFQASPLHLQTLTASFENFSSVFKKINELDGYAATIRNPTNGIDYIPLTARSGVRQWSYLDSNASARRKVIIGDIYTKDKVYSVIEFEHRLSESFSLGMISIANGLKMSDLLGPVNTNKRVCNQSKLDEKFKNDIQFVKA